MPYSERTSTSIPGAVVWGDVGDGTASRILPDGCMDLLWLGDRLVVAGPDRSAYLHRAEAGAELVGLRFGPGWGPAVLGVPADEVRDQRVELAALWAGADVRRLTDEVGASTGKGDVLERIATGRLAESAPDPVVIDVARRLARGDALDDVAAATGCSPRHLRRLSHAAFGYGPKLLVRILRLQRALADVAAGVAPSEAAASAYADQAHLARDVRALTGTTLRDLIPA